MTTDNEPRVERCDMEPKLIDAEAFEELWRLTDSPSAMREYLDKRGLIAPEPVDAKRQAAMKIVADRWDMPANEIPPDCTEVELVLAGMELQREAQPALTREMVRDALKDALELTDTPIEHGDFGLSETHNYRGNIEAVLDRLHAALTQPPHAGEGVGHE